MGTQVQRCSMGWRVLHPRELVQQARGHVGGQSGGGRPK